MFNVSWKPDARNEGMIMYSGWKDVFPKADYRCVLSYYDHAALLNMIFAVLSNPS
jgi:hypothetical protein